MRRYELSWLDDAGLPDSIDFDLDDDAGHALIEKLNDLALTPKAVAGDHIHDEWLPSGDHCCECNTTNGQVPTLPIGRSTCGHCGADADACQGKGTRACCEVCGRVGIRTAHHD